MTTNTNKSYKPKVINYGQLFLSFSIIFGTWVIYIPTITEKLNMSEGNLGIALLIAAIGALTATPIGKILTNKYGEGRIAFISACALCITGINLFIAPSFHWLCVALFIFGFSTSIMQVSINSLVAAVEQKHGVAIMATCHGFFSLGGILAAGFGTFLVILIGKPLIHICISATIVLLMQLYFRNKYYFITQEHHKQKVSTSKNIFKSGLLWALAFIGISAMVAEGAIADWSGLFLKDITKIKIEYVGLGYAGFSLSMTIGRFTGDFLSRKFGAWQIVVSGFTISLFGFIVVLLAQPVLSIIGFVLVGVGFSSIVPQVFRQSANLNGISPAGGIAFLSGASNIGFMGGPVVLGFIAEDYGLSASFIATAFLVALGAAVSIGLWLRTRVNSSIKQKTQFSPESVKSGS